MRNYRKAFFFALAGNIVFAGALAGIWWSARRPGATQHPVTPASNPATQPIQSSSPSTASPPKDTPLVPVQLSAERLQSIGVKFGTVERKPVQDEIRATGTIAIDETRLSYVQTRFSGYIQKVFADATFKYVRKGEPLFTIYSPQLAAAEREYLVAKQNTQNLSHSSVPGVASGIASLVEASTDRLKQWNVPQREIARLESTGQASQELEIDSPVSGFITERNALPNMSVQPGNQLVIPANGVLHSGTREIVFVDRGGGYLEPRDVQLGLQAGDQYIVLKGLKAGERIVTSANFLIDSESQLQAAIGSFVPPPPGAGAASTMNAPKANVQL